MPEINDDEPDGVEPPGKPDAGTESDDTDPEGADASTFDGWDADGEFDGDEGESDVANEDGVDFSSRDTIQYDTLPDGRDSITIGDPEGYAEFNHKQGDNTLDYGGTCAIVSSENVLRRYGKDVSEDTLVQNAASQGDCRTNRSDPSLNGGMGPDGVAKILSEHGVNAHIERRQTVEDLALHIGNDRGVVAGVNAGELWNNPNHLGDGRENHAVTVTGAALDPDTRQVQGFYINDSRGQSGDSGRFVDVDHMRDAWQDVGGTAIVTDDSYRHR